MIPARIIEISDKVMVSYLASSYDSIHTIAEVENVNGFRTNIEGTTDSALVLMVEKKIEILKVGQQVFIEPSENNKVKIVKI